MIQRVTFVDGTLIEIGGFVRTKDQGEFRTYHRLKPNCGMFVEGELVAFKDEDLEEFLTVRISEIRMIQALTPQVDLATK